MSAFSRILVLAVSVLAAAGCASLPPLDGRIPTTALVDTADTRLGRAVAADVAANPGMTGIYALPEARTAFAARVALAAAAERSLDVQYYIWRGDQVGYLLFEALWQAAGRGVRVRLLLDDLNTGGLDATLAALDGHPNIEVRLYNPLVQRRLRGLGFLTDFTRLNRRMHNKSFTADNQVTIVGGRNVANEYYGAGAGMVFADLDVAAVGAVVREVSREFDIYWNSASAYPAARLVGAPHPDNAAVLESRFAATRADPESIAFIEAVRATPLVSDLLGGRLPLEWTRAHAVYDDPAKTLDTSERTDVLLFTELVRTIGRPEKTLDLVSPYFVPAERGTAALAALARDGVKVRVLTNSLASAEAAVVHSGYAKRRKDLLRAGVRLYEIKPTAAQDGLDENFRLGSSSSSALHAKTFAVDERLVFVGSFNFDPRSARLNTEMGLVIESPTLARRLAEHFDTSMPLLAYEARLAPDGQGLEWIERAASGETRHPTEPGASWFRRWSVDVLSIFPVDWLL